MKSISNFLNKLNLCGSYTVVSNPQIPQKYKIGSHIIQEERLISEGGYGYVWEGHDIVTKKKFAVKKMLIQVFSIFKSKFKRKTHFLESRRPGFSRKGNRSFKEFT